MKLKNIYLFSTHVKYPIFFACDGFAKCLGLSNMGELRIFVVAALRLTIGLLVNFGVGGLRRLKMGLFVCLRSSLHFVLFLLDVLDSVVSEAHSFLLQKNEFLKV